MYTFTPLLKISDFPELTSQFSSNAHFDSALLKAQETNLRKFLGNELYYQLVQNYQIAGIYKTLFEGETYLNDDNESLYFFGVKKYLIEQTLYFYYKDSALVDTGEGMGFPAAENTELRKLEIKSLITQKKYNINRIKDNIVLYLNFKDDVYELWKGTGRTFAGGIF